MMRGNAGGGLISAGGLMPSLFEPRTRQIHHITPWHVAPEKMEGGLYVHLQGVQRAVGCSPPLTASARQVELYTLVESISSTGAMPSEVMQSSALVSLAGVQMTRARSLATC